MPIYRRDAPMNTGRTEVPKLAILLRGWPDAAGTRVAGVLRDRLLATTDMLPMNGSIGIDYFGYSRNPSPEYKSWLEIDLLTHPELPERRAAVVWGWTMETALRLIGTLPFKPRLMEPESDEIARRAARKWGLRASTWSDNKRTKLSKRESALTPDR